MQGVTVINVQGARNVNGTKVVGNKKVIGVVHEADNFQPEGMVLLVKYHPFHSNPK